MANDRRFAMAAPIALRADYDAGRVRRLAKASNDANQTRRLLALALIYDGGRRGEAAKLGGVGLQTVRDWVLGFNSEGPDGLIDRKAPGNPPRLNAEQRRQLAAVVDAGPISAIHGVVRWRRIDLAQWVYDTYGISVSPQTIGDTLRAMGYRKLSARPRHHEQKPEAIAAFEKTSPPRWQRSAPKRRKASASNSGGKTKPG